MSPARLFGQAVMCACIGICCVIAVAYHPDEHWLSVVAGIVLFVAAIAFVGAFILWFRWVVTERWYLG